MHRPGSRSGEGGVIGGGGGAKLNGGKKEPLNGSMANLKVNGTSERQPSPASSSSPKRTPLIPPFMVSAPGKVIVFGEHAVVHGKTAMAASISLRSYLLVTTLGKTERTISLLFPDIGLEHAWIVDDLPWKEFQHPDRKKYYYDLVSSLDEVLVKATQPHTQDVSKHLPDEQRKVHQNAALMFLYLFLSLGSEANPGCIYTLRSTIPVGAGLGSSASIGVCISAALLLQIRALAGPHPDQPIDESSLQIERINRWAFVGELCIHGNPSGVDNTVASGGRAVIFKRTDYTKPPIVKLMRNFPELPLLVVDTRQPRSTSIEVAKVAILKKTQPAITDLVLEAINKVTEAAIDIVSSQDFDANDLSSMKTLGDLVTLNHGLLVSLGVSHPKLEKIRELTDAADVGYTKLTGAGGGGCAITLIKPGFDKVKLKALDLRLDSEGFKRYETYLGGDGVGVLFPAILKNDTEEEGGEEIDQEKFLNAEGRDGVEALVGVGLHQRREGWKFWR